MYNIERNDFINKKFQTSSMNAFFDHGKDLMKENSWELAMLLSFTCIMVFFCEGNCFNNIASVSINIFSGYRKNLCCSHCGSRRKTEKQKLRRSLIVHYKFIFVNR